jgi:hypothetical protein
MKKIIALLALTCLCTAANAANYSFAVNAYSNVGSGSLVTNATGFATSGSLVMTSGADIGSYALFSGGSLPTFSPKGAFIFDNMTFNGNNPALALDVWGLLFVGKGLEINIWGNGPGKPFSFYSFDGSSFNVSSNGASFALTAATPVPAAVWLFGSALMGLIGMGKRKQGKALAA